MWELHTLGGYVLLVLHNPNRQKGDYEVAGGRVYCHHTTDVRAMRRSPQFMNASPHARYKALTA